MRLLCRCVLAGLLLLPALPAAAENAKERLKAVETALQEKKTAAVQAQQAIGANSGAVKQIQEQLQAAAKDEAVQQDALDLIATEMDDLADKAAAAKKNLIATARREAGALGMMLRLSQMPAAAWWLYDGVSLDQERRMLLLRGAARGLGKQAEALRRSLEEAETLQTRMAEKQEQLSVAKAALQGRADKLNAMIDARQKLVSMHKAEYSALQGEMTKLAAAAGDLRALLDKMAQQEERSLARKSKAGKDKKAAKEEDEKELAGVGGSLMPVSGAVLRGFGSRDNFGIVSRGLTLAGKPGMRVLAPMEGKAVFVGPFKGYGTIVILQHANGFHSLLAGFGKVDLVLGQKVLAGEPVGVMGQSKGKAGPEMYFELRRNGEPINPLSVKKQS